MNFESKEGQSLNGLSTSVSKPSLDFLLPEWRTLLKSEFESAYMEKLRCFLRKEYQEGKRVFPSKENFFKAFSTVDYSDVKVVILGQDPYHNNNQAIGLSFAVPASEPEPPSLKNIFSEILSDEVLRAKPQRQGAVSAEGNRKTLSHWANQGVFLLNTVLSVRAHEAFSHRGQGWEIFTDKVIELLGNRPEPIVFLLWGAPAQKKQVLIQNPKHLILTAPHPSPLSAYRGFFGCRHFSKTNNFLEKLGTKPIDWL
jgi:uracil-DNA glycosylase